MAFDPHPNMVFSQVAVPPSPATSGVNLSVTPGDGALFGSTFPFNVIICPANTQPTRGNAEIARCTGRSTDQFTLTRATNTENPVIGPRAIVQGDQIFIAPTGKTFADIESAMVPYSGGVLTPIGLVDLSGASAGQIKFPATQNPSADANTLDDYEEGTYTPLVGGSATYASQAGEYTKTGRNVTIRCQITINTIGTGNTGVITGLPFGAAVITPGFVGTFASAAGNFVFLGAYITGTSIHIVGMAAAAAGVTDPAVFFANSANIYIGCSYNV